MSVFSVHQCKVFSFSLKINIWAFSMSDIFPGSRLNFFIIQLITIKISSEIWKGRLSRWNYLNSSQWNNIPGIGRELEPWVAIEEESDFHMACSFAFLLVDCLQKLSRSLYMHQQPQQCHSFFQLKPFDSWAISFVTSSIP